jgi:hypothetical protein
MQGRTEPCDGAQLLMMGGLVGAGAAPPVVEARAGMQQRDMDELGLGNSVGQVSASAQGCAADGARCSEEDKMRLNAHLRTKLQRGSLGQWRTRTLTLQRTDGMTVAASTVGARQRRCAGWVHRAARRREHGTRRGSPANTRLDFDEWASAGTQPPETSERELG